MHDHEGVVAWAWILLFGLVLLMTPPVFAAPGSEPVSEAIEPQSTSTDDSANKAGSEQPGSAVEPASEPSEATVESVSLTLTIWRGGDQPPQRKRIPRRRAEVEGEARYRLEAPASQGQRLVLLDFAEILREQPRDLDEIALATYIAGANERSKTVVHEVVDASGRKLGHRRFGSRRDLVIDLPAGTEEVRVRYRVEVPHRYWPLGCVWRRCSLSGAVAPLPSAPARGGAWLPPQGRIPSPVHWTIDRVRFGALPDWEPGTEPSEEQRDALAGQELIVSSSALDPSTPIAYPSIFWGPQWHRSVEWHRGVQLIVFHIDRRPADEYPDEQLLAPIRDVAGHVLAIGRDAIDIGVGVGLEAPPDSTMVVVQGPLRSDVAQFHPSGVIVSDQYLELLATERLAKFHDIVLARAVFELLAYDHFAGVHDPSTELWLSGSLGVALTQLWQRRRELRDEYAVDLLASFTFVPAIDRFLYTGQAAFSSAYFRGSEDEMPVRYHPLYFAHELPTGRRIHEKLSDLLSDAQLARFYADMVALPERDPIATVERAWGRELGWFFDQWLGPYPEVDYAIEKVESDQLPDGRYRHRISVVRDAERPLVEPVQVYAVERGGQDHYLVWNGEAAPGEPLIEQPRFARHVFVLETERKLEQVRVDPRNRFVETSRLAVGMQQRGDNNDPLFNNRTPPKARFLYTGFGLSVSASEFATSRDPMTRLNAITALAVFEASLRRDLRRSFNFTVFKDRETIVGGNAAMSFWFGEKRNRQRRRARLRVGTSTSWLNRSGLDPEGGLRLTESIGIYHDTRRFGLWPERGYMIGGSVTASQVLRLDGTNDNRYSLDVDVGWAQSFPLAHHHVLATRVDASIAIPIAGKLEFRSLNRGGGVGGLTGFTGNELFGLAILIAALEYRHTLIDDLRIPILNLVWLRSIGGALFGGTASLSSCESLSGWFGPQSWYGYVGYGLTAQLQILGVTPQFIRVEGSVPLGRRTGTTCLGETLPDYIAERQGRPPEDAPKLLPKFNINIIFNQPF